MQQFVPIKAKQVSTMPHSKSVDELTAAAVTLTIVGVLFPVVALFFGLSPTNALLTACLIFLVVTSLNVLTITRIEADSRLLASHRQKRYRAIFATTTAVVTGMTLCVAVWAPIF